MAELEVAYVDGKLAVTITGSVDEVTSFLVSGLPESEVDSFCNGIRKHADEMRAQRMQEIQGMN